MPIGVPRLSFRGCSSGGPILSSASLGAVAQLGERLDRTQEVRGSSPLSSIESVRGAQCAVAIGAGSADAVTWHGAAGNRAPRTAVKDEP